MNKGKAVKKIGCPTTTGLNSSKIKHPSQNRQTYRNRKKNILNGPRVHEMITVSTWKKTCVTLKQLPQKPPLKPQKKCIEIAKIF